MKKYHAWIVYALLGYAGTGTFDSNADDVVAAQPVQSGMSLPRIVQRWADGRIWERTVTNVVDNDHVIVRTNRWTDLATGMHYWDQNHWKVSRTDISIVADGAEAYQGPHKAHFAGNINTVGAIQVTSRDGEVLQSHVAALSYTDTANGQSVLLGQIQDSIGMLLPPNQVVYPDAFAGIKADLRYTYKRDGFEQDVILRENPPGPEQYGLNPATTVLEIWTEFVQAPEPTKKVRQQDGLNDESLSFGRLRMKQGGAFAIDGAPDAPSIPVYKNWVQQDNRRFLVEMVPHKNILPQLQQLPVLQQAALPAKKGLRQAMFQKINPKRADKPQPVRMALNNEKILKGPGLVMDYPLYEGDYTDITFQADTTYLLSGSINCYGTTTFEGGTIIKFATTNDYEVTLQTWDDVVFKTDRYRPAVFTSMNDRTVGDDFYISGTSTNYHCAVSSTESDQEFKHLRVSYANYGLHAYSMRVHDAQFTHCVNAFETDGQSITLGNVLIYDVTNVFNGYSYTARACNVTVDGCINLGAVILYYPSNCNVAFTNSLLVNVKTNGGINLTTNYTVTTTSNIFQTVGAGAHYLVDDSPYRDAGTTNVSATLLADLAKTTTYPPVIMPSNTVYTVSQTLSPQAQRDSDVPDLGYHYDPIDYAFWHMYITNANIQVDPGTALGVYSLTNSSDYGISLSHNTQFDCNGHADQKVTITHYATVQEMANTNWNGPIYSLLLTRSSPTGSPEFRCRFTDFTVLGGTMPLIYAEGNSVPWQFTDCQFHGGALTASYATYFLTNCLFNRNHAELLYGATVTNQTRDCTYFGGYVLAGADDDNHWLVTDTLFAGTEIYFYANSSNIGYSADCTGDGHMDTTHTNDVTVTNLVFQTGTLGYFYIQSNALVNAGSRNATNAGLYHYTMLTNNVKETNSIVDIGFHYVATDANGTPLDYDGDGLPDYIEDSNGNGSVDSGETDWKNASDFGLRVFITRPRNESPIP